MREQLLVDVARFVVLVLYGLTIGHIAWIVKLYAKHARALLPRHISTVGLMFILALTEAAWQNADRIGEPFTWYLPYNLVVMSGSLYAMRTMRRHLRQRHRARQELEHLRRCDDVP